MLLQQTLAFAIVSGMAIELIKILLSAGLSQAEISRRTGIPRPNIHRLLNGKQIDVMYVYGKALERAVRDLEKAES
jgi:predicted transcriptional regulator